MDIETEIVKPNTCCKKYCYECKLTMMALFKFLVIICSIPACGIIAKGLAMIVIGTNEWLLTDIASYFYMGIPLLGLFRCCYLKCLKA